MRGCLAKAPTPGLARAFKHQVKCALTAMSDMCTAHRGDLFCVMTGRQPIKHFRPDGPTLARSIGGVSPAIASRNNQDNTRPHCTGLIDPADDPVIGSVERMTVQIERVVRRDLPCLQFAVPVRVQL